MREKEGESLRTYEVARRFAEKQGLNAKSEAADGETSRELNFPKRNRTNR